MSNGSVAQVGIGPSSPTSLKLLSPQSAFDRLKEVVQSQQFQDAVKIFAIGAAVSASKSIADAILAAIKRVFVANAIFRGRDESFRWILLFMTTHPNFQKSPRAVEVSARPSLLIDSRADYRGQLSEGEIYATWHDVQGKEVDETEAQHADREKAAQQQEEQRQKQAGLGVHFFPAANEQMHFVFEGTHFWAGRERQLVGDTEWDETITLSFVSLTSTPLRRLIKHIRQRFLDHTRGRIAIHRVDDYGNWTSASGISKRSVDSVHLPGTMKEDLLEDAQRFMLPETRKWYADRGIPYRRGYLLYGPPGSGKSSLVHVLASSLDQPIYSLNLSAGSMTDAEFLSRMSDVPPGSIVLIEDVDAAFVNREDETAADKKKRSTVSYSALLNSIDGIGSNEARILVITTNFYDRLDSALIRPGRIDMRFKFSNATTSQARDLFQRWYTPLAGLQALADAFAESIPEDRVSVAALQGFLLSCGNDYGKALQGVQAWVQEQE